MDALSESSVTFWLLKNNSDQVYKKQSIVTVGDKFLNNTQIQSIAELREKTVVVTAAPGIIHVLTPHKKSPRHQLPHSTNGAQILREREAVYGGVGHNAYGWDLSGRELQKFEGHTGDVRCVAFRLAQNLLYTGSDDGTIREWNLMTAQEMRKFEISTMCRGLLAEGNELYSWSADNKVCVHDLNEDREVHSWTYETSVINLQAFPNRDQLFIGTRNGDIDVRSLTRGDRLSQITLKTSLTFLLAVPQWNRIYGYNCTPDAADSGRKVYVTHVWDLAGVSQRLAGVDGLRHLEMRDKKLYFVTSCNDTDSSICSLEASKEIIKAYPLPPLPAPIPVAVPSYTPPPLPEPPATPLTVRRVKHAPVRRNPCTRLAVKINGYHVGFFFGLGLWVLGFFKR